MKEQARANNACRVNPQVDDEAVEATARMRQSHVLSAVPPAVSDGEQSGQLTSETALPPRYTGRVAQVVGGRSAIIDRSDARRCYGRDVFVFASTLAECSLRMGDLVAFAIRLNASKRPQVISESCSRIAKEAPSKRARIF